MSGEGWTRQRRDREVRGRNAEWRAEIWLRLKGYQILDRRARTPHGEIDIVARRNNILAFVEVKARRTQSAAIEAVTPPNRRRIEAAARLWSGRRRQLDDCNWRFDIVAIAPGRLPHHLRDAWRPEAE